jgi:outer membrane protein OmpA-like peptidoglycan-associated protein
VERAAAPYTGSDDTHPMWDEPVAERRLSALSLWQQPGHAALPAVPLNMPVRVTVRHDDLQVHEITLSFPAALLKRALGRHVDPLEMSLSEVQSAFIAPVGAGFTTHRLARPELSLAPTAPVDEPPVAEPASAEPPRRRRRRGRLALVLVVLAMVAGAGWWFLQGNQDAGGPATAPQPQPSASATVTPSSRPTEEPTTQPSSSEAPTVTRTQSTAKPTRKPNVTLRSDLAFGFNSARLSPEAKAAIATVAAQVHSAGLSGKIYVDGYTDNIGSAAYGLVLSQRRADAVSEYLQSQLLGEPVSIVSVGHGESNPVASNATTSGQKQNRRVTITLPTP